MKLQLHLRFCVPGITRKELKTDNVAEGFEHVWLWFEEHKQEEVKYGGIVLAIVLLVGGFMLYRNHEHAAREEALAQAISIQETPVATVAANGGSTFPTQDAKDQAALKAFSDIVTQYGGTQEAQIAQYYLGCIHSDAGKLADAERDFSNVAAHGDKNYASLAKMSLAEVYYGEGKTSEGDKTLRDLIANPTIFVSKEQATLSLAKHLTGRDNAEVRKLLAPLQQSRSLLAGIAQSILAQLPPQ
jgi:predicted negative regulator of RcsB-dependent stress response